MKYKELLDDMCYDCKSYPCNMLKNNTHCHTYNQLIEALENQKWHKTSEEKLTEQLNTYTKEDLINLYLQIRFERDLYLDMYSETQRWHNTIEEKPTEEKQYLCCSIYMGKPYFKVMRWSNNLYKVDKCDFFKRKRENGFYTYDSEDGYVESSCDYWKPIDWYWEPIDWSDDND